MTDTHTHTERQEINGNMHPHTQQVNSIVNTSFLIHVRYILYWENIPGSICCLLVTLMTLLTFSLYPGLHATLLLAMGGYSVSFLFILSHLLFCVAAGREPHNPFSLWMTGFTVDKDLILNQLSFALDLLTPHLVSVLELVFFSKPRDSITGFILLWILSYFTPYISFLEIAYIAVFTLFSIPKTYEKYQERIDSVIEKSLKKIEVFKKRILNPEKPGKKTE